MWRKGRKEGERKGGEKEIELRSGDRPNSVRAREAD